MSLPETLAAARLTATGLTADIPCVWGQGRTTYGGFSAALALAAAQRAHPGLPALRSATINFVGPLAGTVEVETKVLRQGRNATWIAAEVAGEAGTGLTATFVFMGPVDSQLHLSNSAPPAGWLSPDAATAIPHHPNMPAFIAQFDRRFAVPRTPAPEPVLSWWVRARDAAALDPMVHLMLVADALPPAVLPLLGGPAPVSSMTWLINLLTPAPATRDDWWLVHAAANYAEDGCSSQDMGIWDAEGRPVSAGMQSMAVFG